jgi:hypothetical protein
VSVDLSWSSWMPLESSNADYRSSIPAIPGLYRVRVLGTDRLAYIGQTGRSLRERTRGLARNVFRLASDPPWNDPHTAAPALWAWHHDDGLEYELSVAGSAADTRTRQCLEDALLYAYRLDENESTLANHGRFHPGWVRPSNRKGGRRMERILAGKNSAAEDSLPPVLRHERPEHQDWLRLPWSSESSLEVAASVAPSYAGVYRLVLDGRVVYLGESKSLRDRLSAHRRRFSEWEVSASWVEMRGALPHHLKERETDLIGAYFLACGVPPRFQYAGST